MKVLSREDILDILYGGAILGTGGGGSLTKGLACIDIAISKGKTFTLASFDELDADDIIVCPYSCGAISPLSEEERKKYEGLPVYEDTYHIKALKSMEEYLGKPVKAVISTEIGAGNTAKALYCAAMGDKVIVDGDPAGRSVPCLQHSTFYLHDVPITPMSLVNKFGESLIVKNVVNDYRAEAIARAFAVASQNTTAVCDHANTAEVIGKSVIRGAISYTQHIGHVYRSALAAGQDYAEAVAKAGEGFVALRGKIRRNDWGTEDGYAIGTMLIDGSGEFAGNEYKIWYQNENIILWKNGEYYITVPDLICVFNDDAKEPQLNPYAQEGEAVSVIILPAPKEWTTEKGLEVFGPRSFGYDVDWKPMGK